MAILINDQRTGRIRKATRWERSRNFLAGYMIGTTLGAVGGAGGILFVGYARLQGWV